MWLWRLWHQSLLTCLSVMLTPNLTSYLWPRCQRVSPFSHSLLRIFISISSCYDSIWAGVFCVNRSVGYLMQDLTVNLVSVYPKDDMGTKNTGKKKPNPSIMPSEMVELWHPIGTKSATRETRQNWRLETTVCHSRWMSPLSTKIGFRSSVDKTENA